MYPVDHEWGLLESNYDDHLNGKKIGQAPTEAKSIQKESYTVLLIHVSTLLLFSA